MPLPSQVDRFIRLPGVLGESIRFVILDDLVGLFLDRLFPGFRVTGQGTFRLIRDTDVEFDDDAMNPHIAYLDENNIRHDVWFLDGVTALNQMSAAQSLGIDTFALWRLGSEDRSLWAIWDKPGEAASAVDAIR